MSVFQRLLKIDQKVAMAMAMDMLTAGVDTVSSTIFIYLVSNYLLLITRVNLHCRQEEQVERLYIFLQKIQKFKKIYVKKCVH